MSLGSLAILVLGMALFEVSMIAAMKTAIRKMYLFSVSWLIFFVVAAFMILIGLVGLPPVSAGYLFLSYGAGYVFFSFVKMCYYALKGNTENAIVSFMVLVVHIVIILGGVFLLGLGFSWPWAVHLFVR